MKKKVIFFILLLAAVSFLQLYFYDNFIFMNWKCLGRTCFSHSIAHELFLLRSLSHALMFALYLTFFRSFCFRIFFSALSRFLPLSLILSFSQIRIYHMSGLCQHYYCTRAMHVSCYYYFIVSWLNIYVCWVVWPLLHPIANFNKYYYISK